MSLEEKVQAVEQVFENLDLAISDFQRSSGLRCTWGCGKCCFKADIEATALEFLPFAFHLYKNGNAENWLEQLSKEGGDICVILNEAQDGAGLCSQYKYRGLICRLFGYSARTNKYGKKELVTCQVIKSEQTQEVAEVAKRIDTMDVPVMNQYYMQLHAIDFAMAQEFLPINSAIKRAIELTLHYYAYR